MQLKKEKVCLDTKKAIILIAWLSLGQVIFQYLMQKSSSVSSYLLYIISPQILIMNFIPIFLIMILLYFITNRVSLSFAIFSVFFQVLLIINHYKIYFRDEPLKPTDFVLGRETATMLNTYKLPFSFKIVLLTLLLIFVIIYLFKYVKNNKTKIVVRLTGIVSTLIVMFLSYTFVYSSEIIYQEISWVPNEYYETFVTNCKGFTYSFINSFSKLDYKKPESYDINKVKEILSSYETEKNEEVVPNVIAVMSEAFFDPQTSENLEFHTGKNPLLHYNKIKKDSYYGNITVPGFAGATALTEFEFLTGINISLIDKTMPSPYNRFINKPIYALPQYFKENGFETVAIHPGHKWFYNRGSVYKYLGFDRSIFLDDLSFKPEMTNYYTNDSETAKLIIEDYKNHLDKNPQKGYFNFTVTIQNHGPYILNETERPERVKRIDGISNELFNTINNYMDGLSDADNFLKEIKDFIDGVDKPTVLIFFGDHLPYFDSELIGYNAIGYDITSNDFQALNRKYSTPYIICANNAFKQLQREQGNKVKKGMGNNISSNYLITELFNYMNVEMPPYVKYINELKSKVNIISPSYYVYEKRYVTELPKDIENELETLKNMQYYNIKEYGK